MRFRVKMTLAMLCLLSLLFALGGTALMQLSFSASLSREREHARESALLLAKTLRAVSVLESWTDPQDAVTTLDSVTPRDETTAVRLSSTEETLFTRDAGRFDFADFRDKTEPDAMSAGFFRDGEGRLCVQATACLQLQETRLYLSLGREISALEAEYAQQLVFYRRVYLLLLGLCAVLSYGLAAFLTRPLSRLSRSAREIASGNFASRSRVDTGDEIGTLSRDFDRMAERVEGSMETIRNAMERQTRFMGSFTHELKTPMTSIIGYADLLRGGTLSREEAQEAADTIFREGRRLENLSMTLLDIFVAEKTEFRMKLAAPGELMQSVAEQLAPTYAKSGVAILVEPIRGYCMLEPDLVRTLLINLMDNARKAMPEGGEIRLSGKRLEDGCEIRVADTGRGIPPEAIAHLTEAFYRVDKERSRAQGGAGLGLALAAKIVELHHGDIRFESEVGKGTTVIVTLRGGGL